MFGSNSAAPANFLADESYRANFNTTSTQNLRARRIGQRTVKPLAPSSYRTTIHDASVWSSNPFAINELGVGIQPGSLVGTSPAIVRGQQGALWGPHFTSNHGTPSRVWVEAYQLIRPRPF